MQEAESGAKLVDSTVPGAAAVNQKGKWDYLIGVALACFIGLLNGSLSGDASSHAGQEPVLAPLSCLAAQKLQWPLMPPPSCMCSPILRAQGLKEHLWLQCPSSMPRRRSRASSTSSASASAWP